ncbi:MAG: Ku protein [Armatimonadetes bacterium]|nr:Ku protein [Armatimonadota bacterium]
MATTVWKGHLTFGLISVPVRLHAAARTETVSFNQIHQVCGSRIKQQIYCPKCERVVDRKELVKGHEVDDGQYVVVADEEINAIKPQSARAMEVLEFVRLKDVDPVYFNASYYLVPEGNAGEKPYYLLYQALEDQGYVGIAKIVMHQREHIVIVRPSQGGLMLHTIHYGQDIRKVAEYGQPDKVDIQEKELELARLFVDSLANEFEPEKYKDQYRENLVELIQAKAAGKEVRVEPVPAQPPAMDLMAALKASLEKSRELPPKRPATAVSRQDEEVAKAQ